MDGLAVEFDRGKSVADGNERRAKVDARALVSPLLHCRKTKDENRFAVIDGRGRVAHWPEVANQAHEHRDARLAAIALDALGVGE